MSDVPTFLQRKGWKQAAVSFLKNLVLFVLFAVIYVAVGRFGRRLDSLAENWRVFFPQSGVGLAILLLFGLRFWPAIAVGSALNLLLTRNPLTWSLIEEGITEGRWRALWLTDDPAAVSLAGAIVGGNTLSALFAAAVLRHGVRFSRGMGSLNDVGRFLLYAVMLAPVISSAIATWRFVQIEPRALMAWESLFFRRWMGQAVSHLLIVPTVLSWSRLPERKWTFWQLGELVLILACLVTLAVLTFTRASMIGLLNFPVSYFPFPVVLWAGLRFGVRGASTATLILAAIAIYGSSQFAGPFVREPNNLTTPAIMLQVYLFILSVTGLLLGAVSTERRQAMAALAKSHEEMQRLAANLQVAREEERAHLARELHDELAQLFAGLKMAVHRLARMALGNQELEQRCREISQLTDEALESLRRLATELRPGILDDLGLVEAIEWQCQTFERRYGLTVLFEKPVVTKSVSKDVSLAIFRVLQEALTNVAKHARASQVIVRLSCKEGICQLDVIDDGCGFDERRCRQSPGLGIVGMRERLRVLGGELVIRENTAFGRGTHVTARVALDAQLLKI